MNEPDIHLKKFQKELSAGTVCKVKDINVLTASPEDCATIGGEATHTLTQSAKPITK